MRSDNRSILHLDLDTFFVSVERLVDSRLEGKPILLGGTSDRGVVASCSYEARAFGVHSAMPMQLARKLCPEAIVIRGDSGKYSEKSDEVTNIIKESVPLFEKSSIDEFYVDLTGMDRFFGNNLFAKELRQRIIKETGLPLSVGLSGNKTVSKVATGEAKPNGEKKVGYGEEKTFLAPLPIAKIPMLGEQTAKKLTQLGVYIVKTLQEIPVEMLERLMGKNGVMLWQKANGIDNSPVIRYFERKSISTERTFDQDTIDVKKLKMILTAMAESLSYQLRCGNKLTACLTLKLRYSDFNTFTKQVKVPYTSCDHVLIEKAKSLFDLLYQRRMMVRLIGLKCSHLVTGRDQIGLFENNNTIRLYQEMDYLRNKYDDSRLVRRASSMDVRNLGAWNPFNGEPPVPPAHRHQ